MTTYVTPLLRTIYTEIGSAFVLWMRPTVTIVTLIRKTTHANTHNRLTAKLWPKQVWVVLLNWVIQKDNSTTSTRTPQKHTHTQKKSLKVDLNFQNPLQPKAYLLVHVLQHTQTWRHTCVFIHRVRQTKPQLLQMASSCLTLSHTHTHTKLKLTIS